MTSAVFSALVVLAVVVGVARRKQREARDAAALRASVEAGQHIPPSLHPIIDASRCIGSFSCLRACPEGGILGIVDGMPTLVEASHCIGHARCASECPVQAIHLVFGTKEKGIDLPESDEGFESSRAGVFLVGELGGMGLIKNALRQGLEVAGPLAERLARLPPAERAAQDGVDVVVVGAGPAGLACAVACEQRGLRALCVEQEASIGGTIAHYPRGKVVMTERVELPFLGAFG